MVEGRHQELIVRDRTLEYFEKRKVSETCLVSTRLSGFGRGFGVYYRMVVVSCSQLSSRIPSTPSDEAHPQMRHTLRWGGMTELHQGTLTSARTEGCAEVSASEPSFEFVQKTFQVWDLLVCCDFEPYIAARVVGHNQGAEGPTHLSYTSGIFPLG
eukprot:4091584-Pyramimonas_sp.AAC.1